MQTTCVGAWSIEVHYEDRAVDQFGHWKRSELSGNQYAVFVGKHVPAGLSVPVDFASRDEIGCMLSRKFDPNSGDANDSDQLDPSIDWHHEDWDFVKAITEQILRGAGFRPPWDRHGRAKLAGALANWIKDKRLSNPAVEDTLHPVEFLDTEKCYCGGAANTFVAMCSILKIPARYFGTIDHAFAEFQDEDGVWHFVENQPDTFLQLQANPRNPFDAATHFDQAHQWTLRQNHDAVFQGGVIDVIANPSRFQIAEIKKLGWFYNWSCPETYKPDGSPTGADLMVRPQVLHDWVFNLYTGYGTYEQEHMRKRGMFMAEHFGSVYELAALYSPRRDDLPYVCSARRVGDKQSRGDNVIFLTPWRDSYYNGWSSPTPIQAGPKSGVRKPFYLSDRQGISKVVATIILGQDNQVDHSIPDSGGDWYYEINGNKYPLSENGGFELEPNYQSTGMTVHRFEIPMKDLNFEN